MAELDRGLRQAAEEVPLGTPLALTASVHRLPTIGRRPIAKLATSERALQQGATMPRSVQAPAESPRRRGPRRFWTRDRIIASIYAHAAEDGVPPTPTQWRHAKGGPSAAGSHPNATTVRERYSAHSPLPSRPQASLRQRSGRRTGSCARSCSGHSEYRPPTPQQNHAR